jgi:hypothetical protein
VNVPVDADVHIVMVAVLSSVLFDTEVRVIPSALRVSVCETTVVVSATPPSVVMLHISPGVAVATIPATV